MFCVEQREVGAKIRNSLYFEYKTCMCGRLTRFVTRHQPGKPIIDVPGVIPVGLPGKPVYQLFLVLALPLQSGSHDEVLSSNITGAGKPGPRLQYNKFISYDMMMAPRFFRITSYDTSMIREDEKAYKYVTFLNLSLCEGMYVRPFLERSYSTLTITSSLWTCFCTPG